MPTTIPLVSHRARAELLRGDVAAQTTNDDFIVVAVFSAAGLALTIGFSILFPTAANVAAALIGTVT
jgi:hypothetical protein